MRDHFLQVIDQKDRLFVAKLTGETAWHNLMVSPETAKAYIQAGSLVGEDLGDICQQLLDRLNRKGISCQSGSKVFNDGEPSSGMSEPSSRRFLIQPMTP